MNNREDPAALRREIKRLRAIIAELTPSIVSMLKRRGLSIYKSEPGDDLLLPASSFLDNFYTKMQKYSFRLFLRDVIKHQKKFTKQDVTRYTTAEVVNAYIGYLIEIGLVEQGSGGKFKLATRPIRSFGETLEWFLAEIFKREYSTEAIWGVKFKNLKAGGDYDLIAKLDSSLLYMEVKSSPPKQVYSSEIAAFLARVEQLAPAIAIFFMDTELRMKDKMVPMFEKELAKRQTMPPAVLRLENELFQIENKIFIVNAKGGITSNLEKILNRFYREKS